MKKQRKKSTIINHRNGATGKQSTIDSYFILKTPNADDVKCSSAKSFVESPPKVEEVTSAASDTSPDIIEATPRTKSSSALRLSFDLQSEENTSKRTLFLDTSNLSTKCDRKRSHEDDVLCEILDELENSPPKNETEPKSPQPSDRSTVINSLVPVSSRKRLKLSSSRIKLEPDCDINLDSKETQIPSVATDNAETVVITVTTNRIPTRSPSKKSNSEDLGKVTTESGRSKDDSLVDVEDLGDFFENVDSYGNKELDLSEWKYCKIVGTENQKYGVIVTVEEINRDNVSSSARCLIRGHWSERGFKIGDVISVKATFDASTRSWLVNERQGFVVKYPDVLVTGTNIVGSLFCLRSAILSYLFPGMESFNVSMLVGSLVHELFQEILSKKLYAESDIKSTVVNLVKRQRVVFQAYECGVSLAHLQTELEKFVPRIRSFVQTYIKNANDRGGSKMWAGQITEILSVEENFWMPRLGIKGKTDLVVRASQDGKSKTLPVELKTGRASNTAEHRGQVVLYMLMMSELGMSIDSGLLLYLREDVVHEVKPHHSEFNGLITMRNNLVDYFVENKRIKEEDGVFAVPALPKPIDHRSGCARCPYLTVCAAALTEEPRAVLAEGNPLNELGESARSHLTRHHIRYVFQWLGLLKLEEFEASRNKSSVSDIWHLSARERQKRGGCINELKPVEVQEAGNKLMHYMERSDDYDFRLSGLQAGDYVVVSEGTRYAVVTGFVDHIAEGSICLKLDRKLPASKCGYIVDKYAASESSTGFHASSLLTLLEDSPSSDRLRRFVIDLQLPRFSAVDEFASKCLDEATSTLNSFQKGAVVKTLTADDYCLIRGMPGTGKTATIVALVRLLSRLGHSILITSHTHSAVDNILLQLNDVDFLRLGSSSRVHPQLRSHCEEFILKNRNFDTIEDVENFYSEKRIVGVTCMGCSHVLLGRKTFDYCIVDEATQVLQPAVLKAIKAARKFVLVGDPEQLPPVVQCREASRLGLSESLFKRLDRPEVVSVLSLQYRMNAQIMKLANEFVYENALQCDDEGVRMATIRVDYPSEVVDERNWLELPLSGRLTDSIVFLNVVNEKASDSSSYCNEKEADLTFAMVEMITKYAANKCSVGIIAPYREQIQLLKKMADGGEHDVEINTIDQYQGRDKDVIIFSCTKSSYRKDEGILGDKRRITVAITRAKRKLIIIGNLEVLRQCSTFAELLQFIRKENIVDVT